MFALPIPLLGFGYFCGGERQFSVPCTVDTVDTCCLGKGEDFSKNWKNGTVLHEYVADYQYLIGWLGQDGQLLWYSVWLVVTLINT